MVFAPFSVAAETCAFDRSQLSLCVLSLPARNKRVRRFNVAFISGSLCCFFKLCIRFERVTVQRSTNCSCRISYVFRWRLRFRCHIFVSLFGIDIVIGHTLPIIVTLRIFTGTATARAHGIVVAVSAPVIVPPRLGPLPALEIRQVLLSLRATRTSPRGGWPCRATLANRPPVRTPKHARIRDGSARVRTGSAAGRAQFVRRTRIAPRQRRAVHPLHHLPALLFDLRRRVAEFDLPPHRFGATARRVRDEGYPETSLHLLLLAPVRAAVILVGGIVALAATVVPHLV